MLNKEQDKQKITHSQHKVLQITRTSCLTYMKDDWQNQKQAKHYQEQMKFHFSGWVGRDRRSSITQVWERKTKYLAQKKL